MADLDAVAFHELSKKRDLRACERAYRRALHRQARLMIHANGDTLDKGGPDLKTSGRSIKRNSEADDGHVFREHCKAMLLMFQVRKCRMTAQEAIEALASEKLPYCTLPPNAKKNSNDAILTLVADGYLQEEPREGCPAHYLADPEAFWLPGSPEEFQTTNSEIMSDFLETAELSTEEIKSEAYAATLKDWKKSGGKPEDFPRPENVLRKVSFSVPEDLSPHELNRMIHHNVGVVAKNVEATVGSEDRRVVTVVMAVLQRKGGTKK
jgi:hypothetical protein